MTDRGTTSAVKPFGAVTHDDVRVDASFVVDHSRPIGPPRPTPLNEVMPA